MRIRTVFLLCIALGSAVGALSAILYDLRDWQALGSAKTVQAETRLLEDLLHLPETLNIERAYVNARLVAPGPATPSQAGLVAQQLTLVDTTIRRAEAKAKVSPATNDELHAIAERLRAIRVANLPDMAKPLAARPPALVPQYLQSMFALQETAFVLATSTQRRIGAVDPIVGRATRLAVLAWQFRDWAGRQTTTLISDVGGRQPLTGAQSELMAFYKGHLNQIWLAMAAAAAEIDDPDLTAAIEQARQTFWERGGEAYDTWVVPNRGKTIEFEIDPFVSTIKPILDSVLAVRDAAMNQALQASQRQVDIDTLHVRVSLLLLALAVAAAALAIWWFHNRVLRPTHQMTSTIRVLASGERSVVVPLQDRTDELGQMSLAVETLRRNAIQADHEQKARSAEKALHLQQLAARNEDLARLNEELEVLASTDLLTGLANRKTFQARIRTNLASATKNSFALLYIDLDLFKHVNDTFGHPVGDALLQAVATRLRACVREHDLVARLGGDEFAIVQNCADEAAAQALAVRILEAIAQPFILGEVRAIVGASIGIAIDQGAAADLQAITRHADVALYKAKLGGRNTYRLFEPAMELEDANRASIEYDLRLAIDRHQLELHYQPLVDVEHGTVTGYEALVRWNHPERGPIPPTEFIPIAEEAGLIDGIGRWVLERACTQAANWPKPAKVAVNLSPVQFAKQDLVAMTRSALERSGLPPARLELEITESALPMGDGQILDTLAQLHQLGVRIALDSFGVGYSSLSYLGRFPFDRIKLDRSFTATMTGQKSTRAVMQSVCTIARTLGMSVTAKGVERSDQLQEIERMEFGEVQGFFLGHPTPHPFDPPPQPAPSMRSKDAYALP